MTFWEWLLTKFGAKSVPLSGSDITAAEEEYWTLYGDVYIRELAFWSAVNLIASAISKCEFKTYLNGQEIKGREYYLWNIEPNRNQNSTAFLQKLISQLYRYNECLVIEVNNQLLVADSFQRQPYAVYDDVFTQVVVGELTFNRLFTQSEVLYFRLNDVDIKKLLVGLYESYAKLIAYSMKSYQRSRGVKGIFKYDTLPVAGTEERKFFDALINEKIKKWLESDSAALPLGQGQAWQELQHKVMNDTTRDIRAQIDDIYDFTARAFKIPPALLRGDVANIDNNVINNYLTFCIDPLADMLQEEINRKRNGYEGFSRGTYLKIDTKAIKHIDLLDVATAIDKLIASGCFTINDIRRTVGDEPIDAYWADQHFITKNYSTIEDLLKALEGGE